MSPEDAKSDIYQNDLHRVILLTEVGINLKDRFLASEKHLCYLKSLLNEADRSVSILQNISKSTLHLARQLTLSKLDDGNTPKDLKVDYNKLINVIEKQLTLNLDDNIDDTPSILHLSEKIKALETKQRNSDNNLQNCLNNSKCKADVDEKYPENLSRESLIDLSNLSNLPPVPEDIFTSFSNKPTRSSSLSSLKSMRKVKLFLQKAESSDEEESSENEEHDYSRLIYGDSDDSKMSNSPISKKLYLGNIKEESND